jgi:hypothetical protein
MVQIKRVAFDLLLMLIFHEFIERGKGNSDFSSDLHFNYVCWTTDQPHSSPTDTDPV